MERTTSSNTERLVVVAFLIALNVVLNRFCSISTPILIIGFSFLPVVIVAMLYGPVWAAIAYALGDFIGAMIFPTGGSYFPGFRLSAFLAGLIYGLMFYKHEITLPRVVIACSIVALVVNLGLNTYWLTLFLGKGYFALLPARAVKELISIPVYSALVMIVNATVMRAVRTRVHIA